MHEHTRIELSKEFTFEASHILPKHPGKCSRLHGHSWVLYVFVKGQIDVATGFVMDYADIKKYVQPIIEELDHRHLGTAHVNSPIKDSKCYHTISLKDWMPALLPEDFYPSSENLIVWLGKRILKQGLRWSRLVLKETCTSACELTFEEFNR